MLNILYTSLKQKKMSIYTALLNSYCGALYSLHAMLLEGGEGISICTIFKTMS